MTNYGIIKNGLPAERSRGLMFAENFENAAEVVKNGGTINGSPTIDNGIYSGISDENRIRNRFIPTFLFNGEIYTLQFIIKAAGNFDGNFIRLNNDNDDNPPYIGIVNNKILLYFGTGNYMYSSSDIPFDEEVMVTIVTDFDVSNDNTKIYFNDVNKTSSYTSSTGPGDLGSFSISSGGVNANDYIKEFKIFRGELTEEDILAYYNNTTFTYEKYAEVILPMDLKNHDPTGEKNIIAEENTPNTQDVSGNNNHATFGDGSTSSTFPTKLTERKGYFFDGSNSKYMKIKDMTFDSSSHDFTIIGSFRNTSHNNSNYQYGICQTHRLTPSYSSDFIIPFQGSLVWMRSKTAGTAPTDKNWHRIAMVWDLNSETYDVYLDGEYRATSSKVSDYGGIGTVKLGNTGDITTQGSFLGETSNIFMTKTKLSPIQIKDDYLKWKQRWNIK